MNWDIAQALNKISKFIKDLTFIPKNIKHSSHQVSRHKFSFSKNVRLESIHSACSEFIHK